MRLLTVVTAVTEGPAGWEDPGSMEEQTDQVAAAELGIMEAMEGMARRVELGESEGAAEMQKVVESTALGH